ncbi:MAG: hypothetical protein WCC04_16910 [Terriglobales bacterium]
MADRSAGSKAAPGRKLKKEQSAAAPSIQPEAAKSKTHKKSGDLPVRPQLEKGISELQGLYEVLLSGDLDPRVLTDFRDALNRVRTAAWAAQQYVVRKEIDQDATSVLSFLAGERIRAAYQLCQAIGDDLKRTDIKFQAGSLVQLHDATQALTEQLNSIINRLG